MLGANNIVKTKRPIKDNENKTTLPDSYYLIGLDCYIENVDPTIATIFDGQNAFFTKKMVINGSHDIKIGDYVEDLQERSYKVIGVQNYENNYDTGDLTEVTMVTPYTTA